MDIGKFPPSLLERLLQKTGTSDPRVLVGPGVGEDAAVLDLGETLLVAKSDPITFATDRIGSYVVQVNANDIACTGGVPRWFLATLLVPERFTVTFPETEPPPPVVPVPCIRDAPDSRMRLPLVVSVVPERTLTTPLMEVALPGASDTPDALSIFK